MKTINKKKLTRNFLVPVVSLMLATSLFSCGWFIDILIAPAGYVYDAKSGEPLSDVIVKLTSPDGFTEYTALTGSAGSYSFAEGVDYGKFELTATKTNYIFTEQIVDVTGVSQTLPLIGGFVPGDEVFSIVVFWDEEFADVDAHLSMPNGYKGDAAVNPSDFYDSTTVLADGFFPMNGSVTERLSVYHSNETVVDGAELVAKLDIDNFGGTSNIPGGPETVSVYTFPFYTSPAGSYTPVAADRSGLPLTGNYAWVGTMEYWLNAWADVNTNKDNDTFGPPVASSLLASADFSVNAANPVVYIFDSTGQKGSFTLPNYMDIKTASILRINMFYDVTGGAFTEYFQFLPDVRAYASEGSIDKSINYDEPIVIKGRSRS